MGVKRDRDSAEMSGEASGETSVSISKDEAALYDRQIRLWGLDCQNRIREAKVLVIGLNGLGVEVVKNLTLTGVMSITLMDETKVSESDSSAQFFVVGQDPSLGRAAASLSSIQELNPRVAVKVDPTPVPSLPRDFFASFSVVFVCDQPLTQLIRINRACHEQKIKFFCGDTWGFYGYGFVDLLEHKSMKTFPVVGTKEIIRTMQTYQYCPLGPALGARNGEGLPRRLDKVYPLMHILNNFREQHGRYPSPASRESDYQELKTMRKLTLDNIKVDESKVDDDMLSCVFGELSPVCAAIGGVMANEIVKSLSCQGQPIHNFLLFDGDICQGVEHKVIKME